jgi:hypothetical protein
MNERFSFLLVLCIEGRISYYEHDELFGMISSGEYYSILDQEFDRIEAESSDYSDNNITTYRNIVRINTCYNNGQVVGYADVITSYSNDCEVINNMSYKRIGGIINHINNNSNVTYDYYIYYNSSNIKTIGADYVVQVLNLSTYLPIPPSLTFRYNLQARRSIQVQRLYFPVLILRAPLPMELASRMVLINHFN